MRDPVKLRADIRAHLEAENAWTSISMRGTEELQRTLFAEMKGRVKEVDASVPVKDGAWSYYHRYEAGGQHPVYCRLPSSGGAEQVLFHGNAAAQGHPYFSIGSVQHSPDHRLLAIAIDDKGSEFYTVTFRDLEKGELLPDRLENTGGGIAWSRDGRHAFYVVLDDQHRPCKVFRHALGTAAEDDVLVYEEKDPGFFVGVGITEGRGHVVIDSHDHTTSEVRLVPAGDPTAEPKLVAARERGVEYEVSEQDGRLLILTNAGGAEDFKIVRAPIATPGREHWVDEVPCSPGTLLLAMTTYAGHLVRLCRVDGLPRIVVRDRAGSEHEIAMAEEAYALGLAGGWEYDTAVMRFTYSSPTTPERVFEYDMNTRTRTLLKEQEIPSGHDPADYRCARLHATSHDGVDVPVSVLWHKDTKIDGTAPCMLYGYGSYGIAIPASFSTGRLSLVDRGFVYAIAHVRGGKDKGYAWYREGKLLTKKNTFLDFIAAAEHLVATGYTSEGEITIHGGSAGGMLVAAAANMRPELFRAVVGEVPFVDVLTTMGDGDLPLTPPEWPEWGNPIQDRDAYDYISSYSPYDNIESKAYPHILATAGLTDPRVTYWEPAKWVARLRELKTDDRMLLLRTYMDAGHGGAAGRFDKLHEVALVYAFVLLAHDMAR
jgi:oligopeptidase B